MTDEREMRQTLAAALVERARKDDRIVVLDADLMSCHATKVFKPGVFPTGLSTSALRSRI